MSNSNATTKKKIKAKNTHATVMGFYSKWCPTVDKSAQLLETISDQVPIAIECLHLDVDKHQKLVEEYEVEALPMTILVSKGKEIWRKGGVLSAEDLIKAIEKCAQS